MHMACIEIMLLNLLWNIAFCITFRAAIEVLFARMLNSFNFNQLIQALWRTYKCAIQHFKAFCFPFCVLLFVVLRALPLRPPSHSSIFILFDNCRPLSVEQQKDISFAKKQIKISLNKILSVFCVLCNGAWIYWVLNIKFASICTKCSIKMNSVAWQKLSVKWMLDGHHHVLPLLSIVVKLNTSIFSISVPLSSVPFTVTQSTCTQMRVRSHSHKRNKWIFVWLLLNYWLD